MTPDGTGAAWVDELMAGAFDDPAGRIVRVDCDELEAGGETIGRVVVTFTIEDFRGDTVEVQGKLFLPSSLRDDPAVRLPLVLHCGYELTDDLAPQHVRGNRVAVTTVIPPEGSVFPGSWAIVRGPNQEIVLAHLVRSLAFVDQSKVVYTGGSAGGYACLMAAAEAFPLAVAVPLVPLVNLAYCCAYLGTNGARLLPEDIPAEPDPTQALLLYMRGLVAAWTLLFGPDFDQPAWREHSPVGQLDRITCPVAAFFTTVDILVPVDQVARDLAAAVRRDRPGGLEFAAELLTDAAFPQVRLLDALGDRADLHVVSVPEGTPLATEADLTLLAPRPPMPLADATPGAGEWFVTVLEEGEPVFGATHFKHLIQPDIEPVIDRAMAAGIGVDQLTPAKLDQLLDRHRGIEWLAPGFPHLDRPAAEQADVERGLRTYCATSPAHARRFADLYAAAAPERRVLPEELTTGLESCNRLQGA
jgi:hypothetical protein